jgi:hypothetical protein
MDKIALIGVVIMATILACTSPIRETEAPELLFADGQLMQSLKQDFLKEDPEVTPLIETLLRCAEEVLDEGPFSVMDKGIVPPSGDRHDYISQGPYWWPDTTKEDGLPYIRRDGVVNPERDKFTDRQNLRNVVQFSDMLSKAFYFSGDEKYAEKAIELMTVWFVDEATRMNPNLEFGQGIPGITEGRGIGIIETSQLGRIADIVTFLGASASWNGKMDEAIKSWAADYLHWLQTSEKGKKESIHPNNHGTWYDVQSIALALYTDQDSLAKSMVERAKELRFEKHLKSDGSQPEELARTKSFNYSVMNLRGLFLLAYLAEKVDVDLWNYKNTEGATLENGLRFLIPPALGRQDWKYEQITPINSGPLKFHLFLATKRYNTQYLEIAGQLPVSEEMSCDEVNIYFY